jgi:hypothetical protein
VVEKGSGGEGEDECAAWDVISSTTGASASSSSKALALELTLCEKYHEPSLIMHGICLGESRDG